VRGRPRPLRPGAQRPGGALSTRSDDFRRRWAADDVRIHTSGVKLIHHPVVGDLDLPYESVTLPADSRQSLLICTAEPGSPTQDALEVLASWSATAAAPGARNDAAPTAG
jgi:hypothetical protein